MTDFGTKRDRPSGCPLPKSGEIRKAQTTSDPRSPKRRWWTGARASTRRVVPWRTVTVSMRRRVIHIKKLSMDIFNRLKSKDLLESRRVSAVPSALDLYSNYLDSEFAGYCQRFLRNREAALFAFISYTCEIFRTLPSAGPIWPPPGRNECPCGL